MVANVLDLLLGQVAALIKGLVFLRDGLLLVATGGADQRVLGRVLGYVPSAHYYSVRLVGVLVELSRPLHTDHAVPAFRPRSLLLVISLLVLREDLLDLPNALRLSLTRDDGDRVLRVLRACRGGRA